MKPEDIFVAFNNVDDEHINITQDAALKDLKIYRIQKWIAMVVCIALLVGITYTGALFSTVSSPPIQSPVYPDSNIKYPQGELSDFQTTLAYYDYADLAKKAEIIIVANVYETDKKMIENGYMHYAAVRVCEVLKGDVQIGDTIYIRDNAFGFTDSYGKYSHSITFDGGPMLEKGNRVLVFLYQYDTPNTTSDGIELYEYVYGGLGKFFYDQDGKYHQSVLYNDDFPDAYLPNTQLEDYQPRTLEEIKNLIAL